MAQCKRNYCSEPAIHHRRWGHKRYCEKHGHEYADKRDAALVARSKMPDCESGISPSCLGKVSLKKHEQGYTVCHFCEDAIAEIDRQIEYEKQKADSFNSANTVSELKEWISKYMP